MKSELIHSLTGDFESFAQKTACEVRCHQIGNHFTDVRKMVKINSDKNREIEHGKEEGMKLLETA